MKSDSTTIIKNMEFLMKELHKEWDRSGAPKASVFIPLEEAGEILDRLKEVTYHTQMALDNDEYSFKDCVKESKNCYVLLRIIRKLIKAQEKCEARAMDDEFAIELDKEEYKMFKGLFEDRLK